MNKEKYPERLSYQVGSRHCSRIDARHLKMPLELNCVLSLIFPQSLVKGGRRISA